MKKFLRSRFGPSLFLVFLFLWGYPLLEAPVFSGDAWSRDGGDLNGVPSVRGRVGCPDCVNDNSSVSMRLHTADAFYARLESHKALEQLLKVLDLDPQNVEALTKISRVYIDFGDLISTTAYDGQKKRLENYLVAEQYARRAVELQQDGTWGHSYVAASLGKIALESSIPTQIDLADQIRYAANKAIALDPNNGFAHHVLGVWQRRLAEVGSMSRTLASVLLWRTVPEGSLEKSVQHLKKAIELNPDVIVHRIELARTYIALDQGDRARPHLRRVQELPIRFSDDGRHKEQARRLLQEIDSR